MDVTDDRNVLLATSRMHEPLVAAGHPEINLWANLNRVLRHKKKGIHDALCEIVVKLPLPLEDGRTPRQSGTKAA